MTWRMICNQVFLEWGTFWTLTRSCERVTRWLARSLFHDRRKSVYDHRRWPHQFVFQVDECRTLVRWFHRRLTSWCGFQSCQRTLDTRCHTLSVIHGCYPCWEQYASERMWPHPIVIDQSHGRTQPIWFISLGMFIWFLPGGLQDHQVQSWLSTYLVLFEALTLGNIRMSDWSLNPHRTCLLVCQHHCKIRSNWLHQHYLCPYTSWATSWSGFGLRVCLVVSAL